MDNPEIDAPIGRNCFSMTQEIEVQFLTGTNQKAGLLPVENLEGKLPGVMEKQLRQIRSLATIPTLR